MIKMLHINITALVLYLLLLPISTASAVGLKENSVIKDDVITLGDIFYDLKNNEEYVLGNAPSPDKELILNARTLLRIAIAMDLPWRPSSNKDKVILRRAATIIEYEQIKNTIKNAIDEESIYGDYEINIPEQYHKIILPHDQPAKIVATNLKLDASRKNFEVDIIAPSIQNPIKNFRIKGQIYPVIKVPVLSRNIQNGSTIKSSDIEYINIKEHEFSRDTIIDTQKLIGMTARRMIIAARPIKQTDIIAPQLIKRGELVTLSLNKGVMNITTQVKALENGAHGDIIRVMNISSNKTLHAMVINSNEVTIVQN